MEQRIKKIQQLALEEIKNSTSQETLNTLRIKYLGRKGKINTLLSKITKLPPKDRASAGTLINKTKQEIEKSIKRQFVNLSTVNLSQPDWLDLTHPTSPKTGSLHPVTQAIDEIVHIFSQIGFTRASYPEVDWDWYAFESLNMPQDHPARDEWETFFVKYPQNKKLGKLVLTPHTSNGQVRELERLGKPPVRMINIARCYRRQQDVTHTFMFHQFEGLVVDENINLTHLKGTFEYFAQRFYGPNTKIRFRPFHFQFTEPSFEVDFSCVHCNGTGKTQDGKCRFCKSGWHEVGGSGMVHPTVLKNGGFDPKKYTGFAFGWGIERTLSLRKDVQINDIRVLYENDIRFLKQF
jgi:phenylalanyl-tRNA synthetase alpha chain